MHLCTGQAQEAFRHLATQTEHLLTWEPEHHSTAVTFFAGLLLLNASLLSSPSFFAWPAASAESGSFCDGSPHAETPHAEYSCSTGWSEEYENCSSPLGWPSSTVTETNTGLEAEASSNACVSSQVDPSPDLASCSSSFLQSTHGEEAPIQNTGLCTGVYLES